MPIENKQPNSQQSVQNQLSELADSFSDVSFNGVQNVINLAKGSQLDAIGYLRGLTENVDKPIFKALASDMINILGSFYASEEVVCCLIKNLIQMAQSGSIIDNKKKQVQEFLEGKDLEVSDLGFVSTLDSLIFIVDTIINIMQINISDFVLPSLDFAKLISDTIVGMIIVAMQEIVFTLRDTTISWLVEALTRRVGDNAWVKCLPFMDFVNIIKRYMHDHGLLDRLFKLINGKIGATHAQFNSPFKNDFPKNVKEIEFLKWLRDVLIKLKNASLNLELCVDLKFDQGHIDQDVNETQKNLDDFLTSNKYKEKTTGNPDNNLKLALGDNNTILINDNNQIVDGNKVGEFSPPSNSEINNVLQKYLGLSKARADQLTGLTGRNNIQGSLSDDPHVSGGDCGYTLNNTDIGNIISEILNSRGLM